VLGFYLLFARCRLDFVGNGSDVRPRDGNEAKHLKAKEKGSMKTLRFGIEIETIGQTRAAVAQAIQKSGGYPGTSSAGLTPVQDIVAGPGDTSKVATPTGGIAYKSNGGTRIV
jgi:hypothetical protein